MQVNLRSSRAALLAVSLALVGGPGAFAQSPGVGLAQRVYDRPDGSDVAIRATMILTEEGHQPRERQMFWYGRDTDAGDFWSLIRFTTPPDIRDTGLLSQDLVNGEEDQWVYLPALGRNRRIPADRKGGRFVGSDLYYEDLQDRKVPRDNHTIIGQEAIEGAMCEVLESVPVDKSNSVYDKRVSWIYEKILIPLRTDFYEKGKREPTKRLKVHQVQKVQGYWTVMDSTMTDLESGHRTRIAVEAIKYDQNLPDELFTQKVLEDPTWEERFRP